nr:hypothetical protein [Tanacetum cinerariifolium]
MAAKGQNHEKGKNKQAYAPKPEIPPPPKREDPAKDSICHEYGETCTGRGIGLRASRKLNPGALSLYMGNDCFINSFVNNAIQVSRNNMVYFSTIPRDVIFEIEFSNSYTNESSIYANKRTKLDLESALLWHCRLGHISKKRIKKLQHDGLLDSTDLEAFEKCVSCMSRKMARKPYTHQVERAKELLGLVHTDHKHEVFETFKVFQKKVENQLGSIMYVVRCTRPDVAFAQNVTTRFQQNPGDLHWTTVKNILKYLRNTKDMLLVYRGDLKRELRVSCYTDAGYLTDADDLKVSD